jgi:hypothetical protein
VHGPGKYGGIARFRAAQSGGGKFSRLTDVGPKMQGPTPTSYFGLGRSEINQEASFKFDRQRRILPGEQYSKKPDFNNVLFHKDKGRGVRKELKGNKF